MALRHKETILVYEDDGKGKGKGKGPSGFAIVVMLIIVGVVLAAIGGRSSGSGTGNSPRPSAGPHIHPQPNKISAEEEANIKVVQTSLPTDVCVEPAYKHNIQENWTPPYASVSAKDRDWNGRSYNFAYDIVRRRLVAVEWGQTCTKHVNHWGYTLIKGNSVVDSLQDASFIRILALHNGRWHDYGGLYARGGYTSLGIPNEIWRTVRMP